MQMDWIFLGSCEHSELLGLDRPDGEHATRSDAEGGRSSSFSSSRVKSERMRSPWSGFPEGGRHLGIPQNRPTECSDRWSRHRSVLSSSGGLSKLLFRFQLTDRFLRFEMDSMRAMYKPIQDRIGKRGIAEYGREPPNWNE